MRKKSRRPNRANRPGRNRSRSTGRQGAEQEADTPKAWGALPMHKDLRDALAEDYATEQDRKFFEGHPGSSQRVRSPYPREFRSLIPPGHDCVEVHVFNIEPGVRARQPCFAEIPPGTIH